MTVLRCLQCGYEEEYSDDAIDAGTPTENGWWEDGNGDWYCSDCHSYCEDCDTEYPNSEGHWSEYHSAWYCNHCLEENYDTCCECHDYVYYKDTYNVLKRDRNGMEFEDKICPNCLDKLRREGRVEDRNNDIPRILPDGQQNTNGHIFQTHLHPDMDQRCPECMERMDGSRCPKCMMKIAKMMEEEETTLWIYDTYAKSYHNSDHHHFKETKYRMPHEHPRLYYGIELEVLFMDSTDINQITKEFITATNGLFVAEYDRSVTERGNGIEFISRPLSYLKWMDESTYRLLEAGVKVLKKYKAFNPQPDTCGLHVHMSLNFFEHNTEKKVKDIKSDMDWIFQIYQSEIEKLSQRPYTQYCASKVWRMQQILNGMRFTDLNFGLSPRVTLEKGELTVSQGSGPTHHDAVIQTPRTIEVRTFKSTIVVKEILATIEFCRAIAHAARNKKLTKDTTLRDIIFCKDCNYLPDFATKKKLDLDKKFANKLEVKL